MSNDSSIDASNERIRASALRHAYSIEDKKRMQMRVADLIIEAFDLPSSPSSDPSNPSPSDVLLFKRCLKLFQPSDFDDLVLERNVDDRCGYALCPRPNKKVMTGGERAWNGKAGSDFKIVPKAELEKWCSKDCGESAYFVRAQLGIEPAWVRDTPVDGITLLHEMRKMSDRENSTSDLSQSEHDTEVVDRMRALSLERGQLQVSDVDQQISVLENLNISGVTSPPELGSVDPGQIEGHRPRKVRFVESDQDS